jgi:hypothetical protein
MSNVAGKAYGMNVVTPMRPAKTWINRFLFMVARAFPGTLSGLLGLSLIHFARWVIIRRDAWPERGQHQRPTRNESCCSIVIWPASISAAISPPNPITFPYSTLLQTQGIV